MLLQSTYPFSTPSAVPLVRRYSLSSYSIQWGHELPSPFGCAAIAIANLRSLSHGLSGVSQISMNEWSQSGDRTGRVSHGTALGSDAPSTRTRALAVRSGTSCSRSIEPPVLEAAPPATGPGSSRTSSADALDREGIAPSMSAGAVFDVFDVDQIATPAAMATNNPHRLAVRQFISLLPSKSLRLLRGVHDVDAEIGRREDNWFGRFELGLWGSGQVVWA